MEKCVKDVVARGKPKKNAIAICYASIMGKGEKKKDDEFVLDVALLDPALLLEGMDVEEVEEVKEAGEMDWKAWAREQFDSLSGKLDGLVQQVKEQLHTKQPAAESEPDEEEKVKCPKCGKMVEAEDGKCPECGAAMSEKKSLDGSMFYKDAATGAMRWLAVYTNKFRDRDHPPEIISDAAHREFVKAVNAGEWPMPEYRLWHIAAPIGRADFLAYHDGGWVVASGTVNKGMERVVELMDAAPFRWVNSHGMPVAEIRWDDEDKTILTRYRDKEITALPEWAAANELTFNLITGGGEMGFSDKDRERLTQMFGDKAVEVEKLLTEFSQKADGIIESKETKTEEPETPPADPATQPPSRQEVADAVSPLAEAVQAMAKQLDAITKALADMRGDAEQKEKETIARTPAASLSELIYASIVKSRPEEARVKGKDKSLAGPKEAPVEDKAAVGSLGGAAAIPFIRDLIAPRPPED